MLAPLCVLLFLLNVYIPVRAEEEAAVLEQPRAEDIAAQADQLFQRIQNETVDNVWDAVNRLVRLARTNGTAITDRIEKQLAAQDQKVQLACARAMCQLTVTEQAAPVLPRVSLE